MRALVHGGDSCPLQGTPDHVANSTLGFERAGGRGHPHEDMPTRGAGGAILLKVCGERSPHVVE
jgi:hypothetical protein